MINKIKYIALELYIILAVIFLDRSYLNICSLIYAGIVLLCFILNFKTAVGRKITKSNLRILIFLALSILIILISSKYSVFNTLMVFSFAIIAYVEFGSYEIKISELKYQNYFDILVSVGIFIYWIIGSVQNITDFSVFILPSTWDKNYTGITIFLLLVYFYKRRFLFGLISCIPYIFTLNSRLLQLSVCLMFIFTFGLNFLIKHGIIKENSKLFSVKAIHIFFTLIITTVVMILLSVIWTTKVSNNIVGEYQSSWNDTSNAIRTRSNIYATSLILTEKELMFYGYDDDIKKVLGVEDENTATLYSGYRLVQPHNLILNLLLKHGVIFTIFYVYLLSKMMALYWNKDNIPFLITYLISNMIMHSLLSTTYLLFFFFVICSRSKKKFASKITQG